MSVCHCVCVLLWREAGIQAGGRSSSGPDQPWALIELHGLLIGETPGASGGPRPNAGWP